MSTPCDFTKAHVLVDLDGTLAEYDFWRGSEHIGEPVPAMLARVQRWLEQGKDVRIFTARVFPMEIPVEILLDEKSVKDSAMTDRDKQAMTAAIHVRAWCQKHFNSILPITCRKDFSTAEIWDDRAVGVVPNMGLPHETVPAYALHRVCEAIGFKVEDGQEYARTADHVTNHIRRLALNSLRLRTQNEELRAVLDGVKDALQYNTPGDTVRAKAMLERTLDRLPKNEPGQLRPAEDAQA